MTSLSDNQAHSDHVHWKSEVELWRFSISEWQKEHEAALLVLNNSFENHNSALKEHLDSIQQHEEIVVEHEQFIAEHERSGAADEKKEDGLAKRHQLESERQALLRDAHERIKRHHYSVMAKLCVLTTALNAEM